MIYDEKLKDYICSLGKLPSVVAVEARDDYSLFLTFSTGEKRLFDAKPLLVKKIYKPLNNIAFFKSAKIQGSTVVWSEDIDIDPEMLYEQSQAL